MRNRVEKTGSIRIQTSRQNRIRIRVRPNIIHPLKLVMLEVLNCLKLLLRYYIHREAAKNFLFFSGPTTKALTCLPSSSSLVFTSTISFFPLFVTERKLDFRWILDLDVTMCQRSSEHFLYSTTYYIKYFLDI